MLKKLHTKRGVRTGFYVYIITGLILSNFASFAVPQRVLATNPNNNGNGGFEPVTICHWSNDKGGYNEITVDNSGALNGHTNHAKDIIPKPENGCPQPSKGIITFCKWQDLTGNGKSEDDIPYTSLPEWEFALKDPQTGEGLTGFTSGPNGCVSREYAVGSYKVAEVSRSGWTKTGQFVNGQLMQNNDIITIVENQTTTIDFYNYQTPTKATIIAKKIVCEQESDLPNWGTGGPDITATTAADWVAQHPGCHFAEGWDFEWAPSGTSNPGDSLTGPAGSPWTTFGSTDGTGSVSVQINPSDVGDRVWLREVLKPDYIPFTYGANGNTNADNYSAEFYCNSDVLNYDNYEWIQNPQAGTTYHCVAWNVKKPGKICIEKHWDKDNNLETTEDQSMVEGWNVKLEKIEIKTQNCHENQLNYPILNTLLHNPLLGTPLLTQYENPGCGSHGNPTWEGTTNADGVVCFDGLAEGNYRVTEPEVEGWTPLVGSCDIQLNSEYGMSQECHLINYRPDTHICGYKFYDMNQDGTYDENESKLPDWTINLHEKTECSVGDEWADSVISTNQGLRKNGTPVLPLRSDSSKTLGPAQNNDTENFYSLGFGGDIVLKFDNFIENFAGNDLKVTETSYGNPSDINYPEKVHVYASQDGITWTDLGEGFQDEEFDLGSLPWAQYVKLVDVSDKTSSKFNGETDGYDVDAVKALNCLTAGKLVQTKVTDANGEYCFDYVAPGSYLVSEVLQEGWINTTPLSQQVTVSHENPNANVSFGNFTEKPRPTGEICGYKWHDENTNGTRDEGESTIPEWGMTLWQAEEVDTFTVDAANPNGVTSEVNLENGSLYKVEVVGTWSNRNGVDSVDAEYNSYDNWSTWMDGDPTWVSFVTADYQSLLDTQVNNQFIQWGTYTANHTYFTTLTGTGVPVTVRIFDGDPGTGIQNLGWYGDNSGTLTVHVYKLDSLATTDTNENGYYCFEGLSAGHYVVAEDMRDGWANSTPLMRQIWLEKDQEVTDASFGNYRTVPPREDGSITVCKYEDMNASGSIDEGDTILSSWEVTLGDGSNKVLNWGFESPAVTAGPGWDIYPSGFPTLGWLVDWFTTTTSYNDAARPEPALLELHKGSVIGWNQQEGQQYAELDTDWNGHSGSLNGEPATVTIHQDVTTIPGQEYRLTFYHSPRPSTGALDNVLEVSWGGGVVDTINADGSANGNTVWTQHQYTLTATSTTTRLAFSDVGTANSLGNFLDNVSLTGPSRLTGENGCTTFSPLPFGTYTVYETIPEGWDQVLPGDPEYFEVTLSVENPDQTVNFLNKQTTNNKDPYCGDGTVNQTREQCDTTAPEGYSCDNECQLVPDETPPTDVCPNIPETQTQVPQGMVIDEAGNCVTPDTPPSPICGNQIVESGEQCDDGNTTSGDGCSATCQTENNGGPLRTSGGGGSLGGGRPTFPNQPVGGSGFQVETPKVQGFTTEIPDNPSVLGFEVLPDTGGDLLKYYLMISSLFAVLMSTLYVTYRRRATH